MPAPVQARLNFRRGEQEQDNILTKKLYVKTYGCQMNVYDSARMADGLAVHGYAPTSTPDDADLVILNTCHIREKAAEKVYSELGRLNQIKQARRGDGERMMLAVSGCVGQAEGAELLRRAPFVDLVMGPQNYHRLPELLRRAEVRGVVDTEFPVESKFDHLPDAEPGSANSGISAFLTIQEGCDRFCTFCVVPYTRGTEYSRPVKHVEAEARRLIALGAREITLLGQNVNAYHGATDTEGNSANGGHNEYSLADLIRCLAELDGLKRLRYTTSHPRDLSADLIATHGDVAALMPFLHLPVQSGSDRILKAMNRQHTADDYRRRIEELRQARSDIALSSDFIVGFPGETNKDFEDTMNLIVEIGFDTSFSFIYSPRPGTPAAELVDHTTGKEKKYRLDILQSQISKQASNISEAMVGTSEKILITGKSKRKATDFQGRTENNRIVNFLCDDTSLIGNFATVKITDALPNSLLGTL